VIKATTCLRLEIPRYQLGLQILVTSPLFVAIHTNRQGSHKNNSIPNMRTDSVKIFYAMLQSVVLRITKIGVSVKKIWFLEDLRD
jgi:hypothetical protein